MNVNCEKALLAGVPHLGNLRGALQQWVDLQEKYQRSREIKENTKKVLATLLAVGLDPEKSTIFIQSQVPEHLTLFTINACGMVRA